VREWQLCDRVSAAWLFQVAIMPAWLALSAAMTLEMCVGWRWLPWEWFEAMTQNYWVVPVASFWFGGNWRCGEVQNFFW